MGDRSCPNFPLPVHERNVADKPSFDCCSSATAGNMRRFGIDQFSTDFSARHQAQPNHQTMRNPYAHIQVVPNAESAVQNENTAPPATFRKQSYSEEAAHSMAAMPAQIQQKPTPSLANMTLGTTFAAKARAAELNAVRNSKAAAKESESSIDMTSTASASLGALKLTKPRTRSRGWKTLNLDEVAETDSEADHDQAFHPSFTRTSTPSNVNQGPRLISLDTVASPQVLPSQVQQLSRRGSVSAQQASLYGSGMQPANATLRSTNDTGTKNAFVSPERLRLETNQLGQTTLQQPSHFPYSGVPTFPPTLQAQPGGSPESSIQQPKVTEDDPFVDLPPGFGQNLHHQDSQDHRSSSYAHSYADYSTADYDFKYPAPQQQRFNLPHPPGLSQSLGHTLTSPSNQSSVAHQQSAQTANTYQRDPKPYTSFTRCSEDKSKQETYMHHLQQAASVPTAQGNLSSSTRTVLYDPITQGVSTSTSSHEHTASQSSNNFLKASEPLPWKNRPVDIYNMLPPTSASGHDGNERASATVGNTADIGGNAYHRSLTLKPESPEHRHKSTEAWWNYDGRGQEQIRAYLEHVADEHEKMTGRGYEKIKRAMERQANFRDDWSDESNATTVPNAPAAGEVINRLMAPVMANLRSYTEESSPSYFNRFSKAPAWTVDGSVDGNKSFFGEDWGKPPPRVGRDPRYRPTFHEGRYTVFEPTDGRVSGRGW